MTTANARVSFQGATVQGWGQGDRRWAARWEDVAVMINPNTTLCNGGSDADNGQTGRNLVMDYYGPRVPIGGGTLCGKDFAHSDRAAVSLGKV